MLGRNSFELIHPEDREKLAAAETGVVLERSDEKVFRFRHRDGSWRWVSVITRVFRLPTGEQRALLVGRDVTEERGAEIQVRHAQKMDAVGRLAGGVAHDFNNLLSVIAGYAEQIRVSVPEQDPSYEAARCIEDAAERAADLTRQLLAFSRKQVLRTSDIRLDDVVGGVLSMLGPLLGSHIRVTTRRSPSPLHVHVDAGTLEQAIVNLAVNARDAMPDGGILELELDRATIGAVPAPAGLDLPDGEYAVIRMADTGVGMARAVREHVFEPFFTTKAPGEGTGLGLSMVHGFVRQSGGDLRIESTPGAGTLVEIWLPRIVSPGDGPDVMAPARARAPTAARVETPPADRASTVLLVEDEPALRRLIMRSLERSGHRVICAAQGNEAIALLDGPDAPGIDLLISDVRLPEMSGPQVADEVLRRRPSAAVLFISGHPGHGDGGQHAIPEGAEFLPKPFGGRALVARVARILAERTSAH